MENLLIKANLREIVGKKVGELREQDLIPAVLYGHQVENKNLVVNSHEFNKIYKQAGASSLLDLQIDKDPPVIVLIHDVQYDPVKHQPIHIDFYQIKMDEKITTTISLVFTGEAPAVKELGGILTTSLKELEVKCLPGDLIKEILVDLSSLKTFDDKITVGDLKVSEAIEILTDNQVVVATVVAPRKKEEFEEPKAEEVSEAGEGEEGEVEAKEGEEGVDVGDNKDQEGEKGEKDKS